MVWEGALGAHALGVAALEGARGAQPLGWPPRAPLGWPPKAHPQPLGWPPKAPPADGTIPRYRVNLAHRGGEINQESGKVYMQGASSWPRTCGAQWADNPVSGELQTARVTEKSTPTLLASGPAMVSIWASCEQWVLGNSGRSA